MVAVCIYHFDYTVILSLYLILLCIMFSYQALWDLQADNLYGKLGDDVTLWIKCLNDIK